MTLLYWLVFSLFGHAGPADGEPGANPEPDSAEEGGVEASKPDPDPEPNGPRLPSLERLVDPVYPAQALEQGVGARVVVALTLDAEGKVLQASIPEPVGSGFDEALLAVIEDWRFTPAYDAKGRPVGSEIQYAYTFVASSAPALSVEGTVRQAGIRVPLDGAAVNLIGPGDQVRSLRTDNEGRWSAAGLDDGSWRVIVTGPGLEPEEAEFQIEAGKVAQVTQFARVARSWEAEAADDEIEVVGRAVAPEITERILSADEIRYLPGSNGDVVKAIQNLPGIARPPLGIGQLIVRGTAPEDSAYYVDGIAIPLAFHFGGLATVVPSDAIEEVAFLPGNFGVRYGRVIGGVVDIRTTQALPERSRGYVSVDIFQANVFAEQRVSERTAITLSGRRSYADAVLNPILKGMEGVNIRAPRYYDLQARLRHQTPAGGNLDLMFLLSDDRFRFVGLDDEGEEEETAQIGLVQQFARLRARYTQAVGSGWRSETALGLGPENQAFEFGGSGQAFERAFAADVRQEFYKAVPEGGGLGMRLGLDARSDRVNFLVDVPTFGNGQKEEYQGWRTRPAVYAEPTVEVGRFTLIPGVRAGAQLIEDHRSFWVDPRFAASARAGRSTRIKLAVGRYSQPALARQAIEQPELGPTWSLQTGIGVEQQVGDRVSIEVNRFYNWLGNGIVGREDAFRFFTGPPPVGPFDVAAYGNEGKGRIAGLEGSFKYADRRLVALATATLSRSVRIDRAGEERLFAYDQPIVLNALASYELPKGWRLGGRVRVSSGNPYTPVVNRIFDHDSRSFRPVYGERDSSRLPPFWSVDVRVDKEWTFDRWSLTAYLDIQNATNNQNIEVIGWTYDYREESPTTGLPLLPAFGIRADW